MIGMRLTSSLAAGCVAYLLMSSAQAAPGAQAPSASTPPVSAQGSGQTAPQPYNPPPAPAPYAAPAPGAYPQPAPVQAYPQYAYPPPVYAQPYYAPPVDTRPLVLDYDPDKPIPAGYHLESNARKGFVIPGAIIFGISYGIALIVAGSTHEYGSSYYSSSDYSYSDSGGVPFQSSLLYIPVLGPWIALGTVKDRNCSSSSSGSSYYYYSCDNSDASDWRAMLTVGGVTQVLGAGFVVLGLTLRSHRLVLNNSFQASVLPVRIGHSGQGLAMVGTF